MSEQFTFKRYELKYMLTRPQAEALKRIMEAHMIPDAHGESTILSLYYDTPDYRLIRRSMEHPIYKEKLRLRSYGMAEANDTVFLELKKKYDGIVYKRRISLPYGQADRYLARGDVPQGAQVAKEINYFLQYYRELEPAVLISYEREAFYAKDNPNFRVTFDRNILWRDYNVRLDAGIYGNPILAPTQLLMEVKTADAIPLWLVDFLNRNNIYKTSFSKYGNAYTAIYQHQMNGGILYA